MYVTYIYMTFKNTIEMATKLKNVKLDEKVWEKLNIKAFKNGMRLQNYLEFILQEESKKK